MIPFDDWQQQEMNLLGISQAEHDRLLDLCKRMDTSLGFSGHYDFVRSLIMNDQMREAMEVKLEEISKN
jgi:hypothetical protein